MIGPLTAKERIFRVQRYLTKKRNKWLTKKHSYVCRKQVAEKRLRIKGRFVTRDQAFEILGMTQDELLKNDVIQTLLTKHADDPMQLNSTIEGGGANGQCQIKVQNFQALIDSSYSHRTQQPERARSQDPNPTVVG